MLTNPIRPTLALAIASALAAGCQAPASPLPSPETSSVPVAGSGATPAPPVEAATGVAVQGSAAVFGKPLANATIRVFALDGDAVLAEGQTDAQGAFALTLAQPTSAPLLRVAAAHEGTTLATVVAVAPAEGALARRVLASIDVVLSEVSTTAYTALYPRLRALRSLTGEESAKVLSAFGSLTRVLAAASDTQRQTAIDAVILGALDANGLVKNSSTVDRAGLAVLRGIPGFAGAFVSAGHTLGQVIGAASLPGLTFGTSRRSGNGGTSPGESTADLTVTIDLPGQPVALRLLALPSGVATVRVTLSGPTTAELAREPGEFEDPMTFSFTDVPAGTGYSLQCRAESPLGLVLGTTSRVLTLDSQGNLQHDTAGRVLEQTSFTLQAGANALSVRLPLGGPSAQVKL